MRTLVQPPPSTQCDHCGGELRLKLVEPANRTLDLENEIFVCSIGHPGFGSRTAEPVNRSIGEECRARGNRMRS
jgi:hypothetical protein